MKRVTENKGKRTAGVDGKIWKMPMSKMKASQALTHRGYRPMLLRRVYIPKSNGKKRPLSIPTMRDRATQALWWLALNPVAETTPKQVVVDLGYRGVDADNPGVEILHRGRFKSMTSLQGRWLKRRQAIETIGHLEADHRMNRCWLAGSLGDALYAVLCAAGYNLRWLLRAIQRGRIKPFFLHFVWSRYR